MRMDWIFPVDSVCPPIDGDEGDQEPTGTEEGFMRDSVPKGVIIILYCDPVAWSVS